MFKHGLRSPERQWDLMVAAGAPIAGVKHHVHSSWQRPGSPRA
jgi:hypothetical protein